MINGSSIAGMGGSRCYDWPGTCTTSSRAKVYHPGGPNASPFSSRVHLRPGGGSMLTSETRAETRRLHAVEKLSKRAIAKRLGVHRNTVTRALDSDLPPRDGPQRASPSDPQRRRSTHKAGGAMPSTVLFDPAPLIGREREIQAIRAL